MGQAVQGIPASPGIVMGPARVVRWPKLDVPHANIAADRVDPEIERFRDGCEQARRKTHELRERVEKQLGPVQAKIFDPQLLMLEDPELVEGVTTYIRDSYLTAERAFNLRVLEFRSRWLDATHARVVDRIADLTDVQARVLSALLDLPAPEIVSSPPASPMILAMSDLTPSRMVEFDRTKVLGVATDTGTRTSHASILARSLGLPVVVGLGDITSRVSDGIEMILDGHRGQAIIDPSEPEKRWFRERVARVRASEAEFRRLARVEPVTRDGVRIELLANLELPVDAESAVAAGADGIGLFRTEFLVIGESAVPEEDDQYEAFRSVTEIFAPRPVVIRIYDLGGDKFPMFLPTLSEENPFLGWRGFRLYETMPELFRTQIRAALRAAVHGTVQILLPMVNSVEEVRVAQSCIEDARSALQQKGVEHAACPLGVMLETPAALATVDVLARHVDFASLGTNDLVQYALAVDRGNARLSHYYELYHPGILRLVKGAVDSATAAELPLSLCGEAASDAMGAFLMIGLGLRTLSCAPSAIPEMKELIRAIDTGHAERVAADALRMETDAEVRRALIEALEKIIDVSELAAIANLSHRR